jgi:multisubunit Na+/H+ antiporter MnhC subunit
MKQDNEPKLWITLVKLVIGLVVIIGGVGLALWFVAQAEQSRLPETSSPDSSWGIANDSPIRRNR